MKRNKIEEMKRRNEHASCMLLSIFFSSIYLPSNCQIFDGHNGNAAAIFTKENLLSHVLGAIPHGLSQEEWLHALPWALMAGFVKTDKEFQSRGETSGTTATFVIVDGWTVIVALPLSLLSHQTIPFGSVLQQLLRQCAGGNEPFGPFVDSNNQGNDRYERGRMVFFEGVRRFELEDLLRASAEMLGKGGFGMAYKAVLDDGNVVAVKRLKDGNNVGGGGKREFEQQMEILGRIRHPNLVSFKAYYFAREEKLLVYDFMPNGSLFWLLHGNRGPGRTPLDWTTRLKIAAGAARGLAYIHSSCRALKLTHGNIKSTNILLDKSGNARVSDFGLSLFAMATTSTPATRTNGYRAPEASSDGRKQTQKSDVYSFGVLLLELLTGKCPSVVECGGPGGGYGGGAVDLPRWVQSVVREEWTAEVFDLELMRYKDIEEEMVGLLQIALACTAQSPDQRPKMGHVVKMIEEIRGVEVSPCHDSLDSVSDSPCLSEDTCGGASQ